MNDFDIIQDLREIDQVTRIQIDYGFHEFQTEQRKNRDMDWLSTPEAASELARRKYQGKYVYICNQGVAGYGKNMAEGGRMAIRKAGIHPSEMVQLFIPIFEPEF